VEPTQLGPIYGASAIRPDTEIKTTTIMHFMYIWNLKKNLRLLLIRENYYYDHHLDYVNVFIKGEFR
jgi:hypothetical protein